jgi:hypothetical protein
MKALALRTPPGGLARAYGASGTALQTLAGCVSAFFALETFDHRRGVAIYTLRVVNRTASTLVCRTWVISHSGEAVLAYPVLFEVEPLATGAMQVPVWPGDFASFDRAIAEVVGEGVHCIVEAAAPRFKKRIPLPFMVAGASLAVGVLSLVASLVLHAAMPRIAALAVAPETLPGTTVQAEYDVNGLGRLSYVLTAPDGRRLQGSSLTDRSGAIPISIPASSQPGAYTLQLAMEGPLGSVTQARVLSAIAPKPRSAAEIENISVRPVVVKPGERIDVAYSANAESGYLRLVDGGGTIWAQKPFLRNGQTQFLVPQAPSARALRVLLHVTKGNSSAQSIAGIVVADSAKAPALNGVQVAGDDDPSAAAATDAGANGTFEVLTRTVRGGQAIRVHILSPRNGMRVALTDPQSHEVAGTDVGAEADVVTLRAPSVAVATRYTVVATFTDGFGQESIVQPVTILP